MKKLKLEANVTLFVKICRLIWINKTFITKNLICIHFSDIKLFK